MAKTINATVKVGESVVASNAKIDLLKAAVAALGVVVDELTRDTVIVLVDKKTGKAMSLDLGKTIEKNLGKSS